MEKWQARLLDHMARVGLTQTEIAKRLHMTQGNIGHWLRGRREITLTNFMRLCKVAEADAHTILFGNIPQASDVIEQIRELVAGNVPVSAPLLQANQRPSDKKVPYSGKNRRKKPRKPDESRRDPRQLDH